MTQKRSSKRNQDLWLYLPRQPLYLVEIFGLCLALTGGLLLFTQNGAWQPMLAGSLLLCFSAIAFWYALWLRRNPVFVINAQGIRTRYLALRVSIPWEEIAEISAAGDLLITKRSDAHPPHTIVILQGSIPLLADHVLALLQERFHEQFARYGICVQHGSENA